MGNRNGAVEVWGSLNLVEFRKRISSGDLILIGQRKNIESDIALPPQLVHSIEFTIENKFSMSHDINLCMWDSIAIVVDMSISPNSGKSILELTNDGFVLSEFLSRMTEIKKKGHDISVRFLTGVKDIQFRQNLLTLAEYLGGKSLEELSGSPIYNEVFSQVSEYTNDTIRPSALYTQLKEAFYMIVTNADDLQISKSELHDLMREFCGVEMNVSIDELAEQLDIQDRIGFDDFYKKWALGPGKTVLSNEVFSSAFHAGQFAKYCYKTLGVIHEIGKVIASPDDFATNINYPTALRNLNLQLLNGYAFSVQTPVIL